MRVLCAACLTLALQFCKLQFNTILDPFSIYLLRYGPTEVHWSRDRSSELGLHSGPQAADIFYSVFFFLVPSLLDHSARVPWAVPEPAAT